MSLSKPLFLCLAREFVVGFDLDLTLVDSSEAIVQASGGRPASEGYDGATLSADEAGAGG